MEIETKAVHSGYKPDPTTDVLEQRIADMEGGVAALGLASGQAATTYAIQTITEAGDNIISMSTLYGGTYNLFAHTFPQMGIENVKDIIADIDQALAAAG